MNSNNKNIYTVPKEPVSNIKKLKNLYRHIEKEFIFDFLLYPYGKIKHQNLRETTEKSQSHTYTSFYRSPFQLEALAGPVLDYLTSDSKHEKIQINVFACSNGAEPYTIASFLLKAFPNLDFNISASDLHEATVNKANNATYTYNDITAGMRIPEQFIKETFDHINDLYVVKPHIRSHVSFSRANIIDDDLTKRYKPADIIYIQNVFCHLDNNAVKKAFDNIIRLKKERTAIFLDGMNLELRENLTVQYHLKPLKYKCKEIYEYSRTHVPLAWWKYYYGLEPYLFFKKNKLRRYSTIFLHQEL